MRTDLSAQIKLEQVPKQFYRPQSELELASLTRLEKVYTKIVETPLEGAADAASDVAKIINRTVEEKGRCIIGLGAGRCALDVYDELVKLYFADKVSFAHTVVFNISELGLGAAHDYERSTFKRLEDRLLKKVDIEPENIHTFSREATKENVHKLCRAYETEIDEYGGLDLVICELTKSGSLAFNDSGSTMSTSCRLTSLSSDARSRIAESYMYDDEAPATAVTLGINNLLSARRLMCVAWGEDSAKAVVDTIEGNLSELTPASYLQMHQNVKLVVDLDAASDLTRINFPWKVTSCNWTRQLIRRAIVWLCQQTGKPILKLTNKDYNDNGLSELVALHGSAYEMNIQIFNDLQHTITGWPGGKPNADDASRPERRLPYPKRVLCFGPHPDDPVVSMGGTLKRLVEQGHDVHVVFETSGDVAISDDDLQYHILLNRRLLQRIDNVPDEVRSFVEQTSERYTDPMKSRVIKGEIFVCEGMMACEYLGIKRENVHELTLPFFTEEPYGNGRISEADVDIIKQLIVEVKPHQIFFADDLNDPYGTHARATNALLAAIDELKDEPFMADCRVWMYRGQWGVWGIDNIEMAVPMSPEEFKHKRDAILKYQSQIHDAPYRDPEDGKLAWQRSIDRNTETAETYSRLGLACYEAMEAFVQYHLPKDD